MARDPNFFLLVGGALLAFAAVALYAPRGAEWLRIRRRVRPPHRALLAVVRVWFGLLALGCLGLLILPLLKKG